MSIRFWLNDRAIDVHDLPGATTLLRYLRDHAGLRGTKEGCAEGDCGACTVVVLEPRPEGATYRAVNSCLLFLSMLQGKRVYTVEGLSGRDDLHAEAEHPAQRAMVERRASQCGYCTPGIVMSLVEACYRTDMGEPWQVDDQLCGNLCRCTGYRPIRQAGEQVAGLCPADAFAEQLAQSAPVNAAIERHEADGQLLIQPSTLEGLWDARRAHPQAVLVAGGTDLGLQLTKLHARWPVLIGLEALPVLHELHAGEGEWRVGAGVSLTRLMEVVGPELPALHKMLAVFGARQIRSRATLGGNLVNASPIGDMAPTLMALGATLVLEGSAGQRTLPVDDFFEGYRQTALRGDEILLRVHIPRPDAATFVTTYKVSKRRELDISICAAGMAVRLDEGGSVSEIRLAYGGMAATPKRAEATEAVLLCAPWTEASVLAAAAHLDDDFSPLSDHRGSAAYRALLAKNLLLGFFLESQRPDRDTPIPRPVSTVAAS